MLKLISLTHISARGKLLAAWADITAVTWGFGFLGLILVAVLLR